MKKNTQRIAAMLLAFGLIAAACSSDTGEGDSATGASSSDVEAVDSDDDATEIDDQEEDQADEQDAEEEEEEEETEEEVENDRPTDIPETVVDIAASSDDFSILVAALDEAQLLDILDDPGPFTVFAPINEAFEAILADGNITEEEFLSVSDLGEILSTHVVSGELFADDAIGANGTAVETVSGAFIDVTVVDGAVVLNGNATVITADLTARNGVVHIIDGVLQP